MAPPMTTILPGSYMVAVPKLRDWAVKMGWGPLIHRPVPLVSRKRPRAHGPAMNTRPSGALNMNG